MTVAEGEALRNGDGGALATCRRSKLTSVSTAKKAAKTATKRSATAKKAASKKTDA
jgi:hypothetical protein